MKVRYGSSSDYSVNFDTEDSNAIAALHISANLKYDMLPANVFVTYKSDRDACYVYDVTDKARLLHEALTEKSAGHFVQWVKANAESPHRLDRVDGVWLSYRCSPIQN